MEKTILNFHFDYLNPSLRARGSQREPEWESQRAIESQRETGREPVRARESQLEPEGTRVS